MPASMSSATGLCSAPQGSTSSSVTANSRAIAIPTLPTCCGCSARLTGTRACAAYRHDHSEHTIDPHQRADALDGLEHAVPHRPSRLPGRALLPPASAASGNLPQKEQHATHDVLSRLPIGGVARVL